MKLSTDTYKDFMPLEKYIPYCERMSQGDEDLRQELFLAAWRTMKNGHTYPARVIHSMQMARIKYRRGWGKSIDNGNPWRRPKGSLSPVTYDGGDTTYPSLVSYCQHADNPEETALFRISFERFHDSLSELERKYVDMKLAGFVVNDRKLGISGYMRKKVRNGIRQKFFETMEGDEQEP